VYGYNLYTLSPNVPTQMNEYVYVGINHCYDSCYGTLPGGGIRRLFAAVSAACSVKISELHIHGSPVVYFVKGLC
jgi:hypothetical protein